MGKQDKETFAKLLVLIGGLIGIFIGISGMLSLNLNAIIMSLLVLILALAALMSAIKPGQPIPLNIVVEVILGGILIYLTWLSWGMVSGILIVIGGILLAID